MPRKICETEQFTFHTKLGHQRSWLIVDSSMNHARVVSSLMDRQRLLLFDQGKFQVWMPRIGHIWTTTLSTCLRISVTLGQVLERWPDPLCLRRQWPHHRRLDRCCWTFWTSTPLVHCVSGICGHVRTFCPFCLGQHCEGKPVSYSNVVNWHWVLFTFSLYSRGSY